MSGGVKLKVGAIDGVTGDLTPGSMAAAIYDEMAKYMPVLPREDKRPRQWLALAIATGVIRHLKQNANAFDMNVRDTGTPAIVRNPTIDTDPASP